MADNTQLNTGTGGDTLATDDISGVKYPRSKITIGADGVNDGDVSAANPLPVTGTITANLGATDNAVLDAIAASVAGTLTVGTHGVTGTFWQATQPVSIASSVAVTGPLTDTELRATPVPISGTVTATTGGLTDAQLRSSAVPVSLASVPSHAVTNAGTFAVQVSSDQPLSKADDSVAMWTNTAKDGSGTAYQPLVDSDGHLQIDILSGGSAGTQYTEGDVDATITGTAIMWEDYGNTLRSVTMVNRFPVCDTSTEDLLTSFTRCTSVDDEPYSASFDYGVQLSLIRDDVPSILTDTDGDMTLARCTKYGAQYVQMVTSSGAFIDSVGGGTQYAEGATAATITGTAAMMEVAADTLKPVQGTVADGLLVNLGANNDVTVTGSVAVTGTFWQATQPVSIASTVTVTGTGGTFPVTDSGGSLTVDNGGTFAVQAAQSGTWNVTDISGTVSLPTGAATAAKQPALGTAGTSSADVITVQGIASMTAIKVDGSAVTQPVSGTVTANAGSGTFAVSNAGITSIDGKITACNTGAVVLASGTAAFGKLAANDGVDIGDVTINNASIAVTGTFWQATQPVSGTVTATIAAGATTIAKAEDVASADADVGVPAMAVRKGAPANTSGTDGDYEMLQMSAGRLWCSVTVDAALPAGTNAIGKLAANTGVTIGAVEIASSQTLATVTTVTTCSTVTTLTGGGVAHDAADSGNPVKVGTRSVATLATATMVAANDRSDATSDIDGAQITRPNFPIGDILSDAVSNTDGASTASSVFTATASTRSCITGFQVFRTDAGTTPIYIDFRDGTGGSVLWRAVIPPNGGANSPAYCGPCLFRTSANTALAYDVSAATTTVYINVSGYKSKV